MKTVNRQKLELSLYQIAEALGASIAGKDKKISQVSINTRTMEQGDLFVAIRGDNFDAHDYLQQAEQYGASAVVVEQKANLSIPQIVVKDTREALGKIAQFWRLNCHLPIISVTGSCGKTTVKEMTAAILKVRFAASEDSVLSTQGNLNNDIGVPLTLFQLNRQHQAAMIELGANHVGEIKYLVNLVQPDVALITNAAHAHIEGFGSIEGVAQGKSEIYEGLKKGGTAIINADDKFAAFWLKKCNQISDSMSDKGLNVVTFGLEKKADFYAEYQSDGSSLELTIHTPSASQVIKLNQLGRHNVYNALAACAASMSAGCDLTHVKQGLESFNNVSGRLEKKTGPDGSVIFDDTYNANPGSVRAGIEAIQQIKKEAVLILGDMGELGEDSKNLHYQLGIDAAQRGIKKLFAVGQLTEATCDGFNSVTEGSKQQAKHFTDKESLVEYALRTLNNKNVVLVKGSRTMGMESIVNELVRSGKMNNNLKGVQ